MDGAASQALVQEAAHVHQRLATLRAGGRF